MPGMCIFILVLNTTLSSKTLKTDFGTSLGLFSAIKIDFFFKNPGVQFLETHERNITTKFETSSLYGFLKKCCFEISRFARNNIC